MGIYPFPQTGLTPPQPDRGVCVREGLACTICDEVIGDGERVVLYRDDRFCREVFGYHDSCWAEADLGAKVFEGNTVIEGRALVMPEVRCAECGGPTGNGVRVVRVAVGGRGKMRLFYHVRCFEAQEEEDF